MSDYQGNIVIKNPATPTGPSTYGRAPGVWKLNEVAYWIKQGVWPNPSIIPDQYFPYVSLLLSTTALGNANNNLFVDSSGAFNPITRNGNTTQGSATPYGASWSNYFDGTGDYLTVPDDNALDFGTGDFTIEMWINAQNLSNIPMFFHKGTSVSTGWFFQTSGSTLYFGQLDSARYSTWSVSLANNAWYHIALTRVGAVLNVFVNGVSQGAQTVTNANLSNDNTGLLYIGEYINGTYYYQGYLSNYRIVKGSAVYTSNFTVPTSPLTAISGTSLLTCQSNRFRDASTNNFTVTPAGNTSVTEFSPFAPAYPGISYNQSDITNWSGYFDGSTGYLTSATSSAYAMGTGDFTIEGWFFTTASGDQALWDNRASTSSAVGIACRLITSTNTLRVILNNTALFTTSQAVTLNQWNHIAIVRASGTVTAYLNGTAMTGGSATGTTNITDTNMWIGKLQDAGFFYNGYISNFRVVKGTAVYTSAFTPPTTNLTAISGTSLLTLQNAAFTDNSTNNFVITPFGNTTVTGNSPFNTVGYWSNYFDGTGDYLSYPEQSGDLGTADWTLECWAYPTTTPPNYASLLNKNWTFSLQTGDFQWSIKHVDGYMSFAYVSGGIVNVTTTIAPDLNRWTHYAVTRSGTTLRIYANGVLNTTATLPAGLSFGTGSTTSVFTGYNSRDGVYYTGYISNLRIIAGTALYTGSTYTVPTTPLTAITNTSLLTCQASRLIDSSTNAFTITRNGDVSVQSFDPFYTSTIASNGGSMYFASTGSDVLTFPSTPLVDLSTSSFTFECWVYFNGFGSDKKYIIQISGGSYWQLVHDSSFGISLRVTGYSEIVGQGSNSGWTTGQWYHVALVRNGNSWNIYRNGISIASATNSSSIGYYSPTYIGNYSSGNSINGYMSDVRITKSAVYTGAFTPPTAPLTPTASTSLLLNGMNAGAYDATAINDMETVGNAQVSTAVSKFGGSSIALDGTGDYLKAPNSDVFAFRTGDFTVEMWAYFADNAATNRPLFDTGVSSNTGRLLIRQGNDAGTSNVVNAFVSGTTVGSPTISFNQWTHVAVVRQSGTVKIYINGTGGTGVSASADLTQNGCLVGAFYDALTSNFTGYIDDLRVTRGVARYTANFTPPTQAFPPY